MEPSNLPRGTRVTSRRSFLKTSTALTIGMAGAAASAGPAGMPGGAAYRGPHEMPKDLTLLALRNADGTETLGVKLDEDSVLDVRQARHLLAIAAPLTLEELLRDGNARCHTALAAAARSSSNESPA